MSYFQHGSRHRITGDDPMPAHYLIGTVGGISVTNNSVTSISLDPGSINWGTEDGPETASDYFDLQDPGSGTYEIALLANALYVIDIAATFDASSAPAANSVGSIILTNTGSAIGGVPDTHWVATGRTPAYDALPSLRAILNWPSASLPVLHGIQLYQNSGSTTTNVNLNFMVRVINLGNTGF